MESNTRIKSLVQACSSVDRASGSDSESQGFNSLHAYGFILKFINLYQGLTWFRHLK